MASNRIFAATFVIGAMTILSACSGHTGIQALERPAVAEDALPADLVTGDPINKESARLLTAYEEVRYFVASSPNSRDGCIIAVPSGVDPQSFGACGLLGPDDVVVTTSYGGKAVSLVRDDVDTRVQESEGWNRIHENVLIPST